MSFCPTRDIHSIYLDNEMPEVYKADYEKHLESCAKCKKELENLKKVHGALTADASKLVLDQDFMDKSYERLMMKMNYAKTAEASKPKKSFEFKYVIPSMAAAAVMCAAILLPAQIMGAKGTASPVQVANFISPMQNAENVSFDSGKSRVISGNIHQTVLASNASTANLNNFVQNAGGVGRKDMVRDIDVFRPKFEESESNSIKITVPGMNNVPVMVEISFPDAVDAGQ